MLRASTWIVAATLLVAAPASRAAAAPTPAPADAQPTSDTVTAPTDTAPTEPTPAPTPATPEPTAPATVGGTQGPAAAPSEPAPAAPAAPAAPTAPAAAEPVGPVTSQTTTTDTTDDPAVPPKRSPGWAIDVKGRPLEVNPFIAAVGGGYFQKIENTGDAMNPDNREDRFTTVALSRLGVRASWGEAFELISEFELNAGPYGTSVWEGQAAMQVRNQLVRLRYKGLTVDVGRITDPTSLDFFSPYAIGNMLLTDELARFPLLISGFNRGNGIHADYEVVKGLRIGFTANAGNPTSTTGTVMVGGTFPPFARFYQVPWSDVGRDARGFPTPSFHVYLLSPSVRYDHKYVGAQFSGQWFSVNTNTNTRDDDPITGYNLRGGLELRLWDGKVRPFVNGSRILNDVVEADDTAVRSDERYRAIATNGGLDVTLPRGFGVGAQYNFIHEQQGVTGTPLIHHIGNAGLSYLILPFLSIDARYGAGYRCHEIIDCDVDREHRFYLTLKALIGKMGSAAGRP